jgi:hypothetical protein
MNEGLSLVENARLFAMLNMAGADSLIAVWDDKAFWSFWRPITAIREADTDPNPGTVADPGWLPLIDTPPYPDHSSGFNGIASGFMHTAQDFFGTDKVEFVVRNNATGATRPYSRFSEVIKDAIDVRVYQGIHFRGAEVAAFVIGKKVAHLLDKNYFQPIGKK